MAAAGTSTPDSRASDAGWQRLARASLVCLAAACLSLIPPLRGWPWNLLVLAMMLAVLHLASGAVLWSGHFRTAAQRQAAIAALQRSEARLVNAQAVAHVGNWELDLARRTIWASAEAFRIYGFAADSGEVPLARAQGLVVPEDRPRLDVALQRLLQTGERYEEEYRLARADDGAIRVVHTTANLVRDAAGAPVQVVGVIQDVTEQRQAEEALRESEGRFQRLIQSVPSVAVQSYGPDGTTLYWNEASERIYGYPAAEAVGRNLLDLIIPPEMREGVALAVRQMADSGQPIPASELLLMRRDGSRVWVFSSHAMVQRPGCPPELFCLDVDISEQKRAEAERHELEQRMQQTQKLESLGVLAGGIAHDFNNILMAVLGHAELALEQLPPASEAREDIGQITVAVRGASELCRQMLAYSGKASFALERLELGSLIEEMSHLLNASISKKAELRVQVAPDLPAMHADPSQIRQVALNLILNASDALGEQAGVITVAVGLRNCEAPAATVSTAHAVLPPGRYLELSVTDTGCGMDAATQARIFEPFFTTKFTGRGLGLAAVLGIAQTLHGAVEVESEPGRGTTFRVLFPALAEAAAPPAAPSKGRPAGWRGHGTVLLADDEDRVRTLAARLLQRLGFEVLTASDGLEAVRLYQERGQEVDLVVLDLTMPHLDGGETFLQLRRLKPDVRVLLASGYSAEDVTERFAGMGLVGVLQKPYTLHELAALLAARCPELSEAD